MYIRLHFLHFQVVPTALSALVPNASDEGIDLMEHLLRYDPNKRLTSSQALQHPFFAKVHSLLPTIQPSAVPQLPSVNPLATDTNRQPNIKDGTTTQPTVRTFESWCYDFIQTSRTNRTSSSGLSPLPGRSQISPGKQPSPVKAAYSSKLPTGGSKLPTGGGAPKPVITKENNKLPTGGHTRVVPRYMIDRPAPTKYAPTYLPSNYAPSSYTPKMDSNPGTATTKKIVNPTLMDIGLGYSRPPGGLASPPKPSGLPSLYGAPRPYQPSNARR